LRKAQARKGHQKFYRQLVNTFDDPALGKDVKAYAATFIAVNQTSFNGLWRVNRQGHYNVPIGYRTIGGQKVPYDINPIILTDYARLLRNAKITCMDFRKIVLEKGDLGYCDPPYLDQFSAYAKDGFTRADHEELHDWCKLQVSRGARIILSGAGNEETRQVYGEPQYIVGRACTIGASNRKATSEFIYTFG
jgi:DNA adenine methylase